MDDNDKRLRIRERLEFFKKSNIAVHVLFDNLGRDTFFNGYITSILDNYFIMNDRKRGPSQIFLNDIKVLEAYGGVI